MSTDPTDDPSDGPREFVAILRRWADRDPDRPVLAFRAETDGDRPEALTFGGLDRRARALAAVLRDRGMAGERALLVFPPGLEFVSAFFGGLYAGVVVVPAVPPRPNRPSPRLRAIIEAVAPRVVLTTSALLAEPIPEIAEIPRIATDALDLAKADSWIAPALSPDDLAFLQFTSGSTSEPRGVMVSHGNLVHNSKTIQGRFRSHRESRGVFWLPLHHDMGLIGGVLQTIYCGGTSTLIAPAAFLQRPLRWLQAISRDRATISGGPNFAYDLCAERSPRRRGPSSTFPPGKSPSTAPSRSGPTRSIDSPPRSRPAGSVATRSWPATDWPRPR